MARYLGRVEYKDNTKLDDIMRSEGITTYDADAIWREALEWIYAAAYIAPNSYPEAEVRIDGLKYIIVEFEADANGKIKY